MANRIFFSLWFLQIINSNFYTCYHKICAPVTINVSNVRFVVASEWFPVPLVYSLFKLRHRVSCFWFALVNPTHTGKEGLSENKMIRSARIRFPRFNYDTNALANFTLFGIYYFSRRMYIERHAVHLILSSDSCNINSRIVHNIYRRSRISSHLWAFRQISRKHMS